MIALMITLFHHLLTNAVSLHPEKIALYHKKEQISYRELNQITCQLANQFTSIREDELHVAVYLPKQIETVISFFATSMAGGVFIPINPLLKPDQVLHILQDSQTDILITSQSRYQQLSKSCEEMLKDKIIILTDGYESSLPVNCYSWKDAISNKRPEKIQTEISSSQLAAILYTSGSTGKPKGVMLSHQNLVIGAQSVSSYLKNTSEDKLLAVLPLSFDYGLSQITTAFYVGASVVLMEYLLPRDVIKAVEQYEITGLAAVPPLWVQLAQLEWPEKAKKSLRYITNSGGAMPQDVLKGLQLQLPDSLPYLMYGLTEAFRSTYLEPSEIEKRPGSMGKAIPNAEILLINSDGKICGAEEEGELVHRGPLVAMGYWNLPEKTQKRFKPLPDSVENYDPNELAVYSGDIVKKDDDGFLYFIGRNDDMIKSSGYRISPAEIEEYLYRHPAISEVAAIGVPHKSLGQAVVLVIKVVPDSDLDIEAIKKYCQQTFPNFMQPQAIELKNSLPRNPNGKINRTKLTQEFASMFEPIE